MEESDMEQQRLSTYSPDLNLIENLWLTLKERVASDASYNETMSVNSLRSNWEIITTQENLCPYFENFHGRYFEYIEKEDHRLPY